MQQQNKFDVFQNDDHLSVGDEKTSAKDENLQREQRRRSNRPADSSQRHDYIQR